MKLRAKFIDIFVNPENRKKRSGYLSLPIICYVILYYFGLRNSGLLKFMIVYTIFYWMLLKVSKYQSA